MHSECLYSYRMEQSVSEYGQESTTLQETNSHLQGRIVQLKDDLQKMTTHYDKCQKELDKKILELEKVHAIRVKDEEHCNHLIETIKQLEEIILQKEGEILEKDKEIQKISQDLMEQQLLLDPVTTNEVLILSSSDDPFQESQLHIENLF